MVVFFICIGLMSDKRKVNILIYLFLSDDRGLWYSLDYIKYYFRMKEMIELVEIWKKIFEECCLGMMNFLFWMFNN